MKPLKTLRRVKLFVFQPTLEIRAGVLHLSFPIPRRLARKTSVDRMTSHFQGLDQPKGRGASVEKSHPWKSFEGRDF